MPLPISSSPPRFVANVAATSVPDLLVDPSKMNIFSVTQTSSLPIVSVPLSAGLREVQQALSFQDPPPFQPQPLLGSSSTYAEHLAFQPSSQPLFSVPHQAQGSLPSASYDQEIEDILNIPIASTDIEQTVATLSLALPRENSRSSMPIHSKKGSQRRARPYPSSSSSTALSNNADLGMISQTIILKFTQLLFFKGKYYVEFCLPEMSMQKIEIQSVSLQPSSLDVTSEIDVYRQQKRIFFVVSESQIIPEGKYVFTVMVRCFEVRSKTRTARTKTLLCEFDSSKRNVRRHSFDPLNRDVPIDPFRKICSSTDSNKKN